jgi:hypothetical protein
MVEASSNGEASGAGPGRAVRLDLAEALWRLGIIRGEVLPEVAEHMLERGYDGPTLCELAALDRPSLRDAGPLFGQALRVAGRAEPSPSVDLARRIVAEAVATGHSDALRMVADASTDNADRRLIREVEAHICKARARKVAHGFLAGEVGAVAAARELAGFFGCGLGQEVDDTLRVLV